MSSREWAERSMAETKASMWSPESRVRALPGAVAVAATTALLWLISGPIGLVGGGVLLVAWAVLPATYAFAVGQIVFVAVTGSDGLPEIDLLPLILVELGLAGVLVGPSLQLRHGRRIAMWTLFGTGVLSGTALASYALWGRVWVAATVLVGLSGLGVYGLHRYELVVLGKVPDPDAPTDDGLDRGEDDPKQDGARRASDTDGLDPAVDERESSDRRGEMT